MVDLGIHEDLYQSIQDLKKTIHTTESKLYAVEAEIRNLKAQIRRSTDFPTSKPIDGLVGKVTAVSPPRKVVEEIYGNS